MTEPTYAPKPIKMLEVEQPPEPVNEPEPAIEPLPTDTSEIVEPVEPRAPIGPEEIDLTPRDEGGESGGSPFRSSVEADLREDLATPRGKRVNRANFGEPLTAILSRLKGK